MTSKDSISQATQAAAPQDQEREGDGPQDQSPLAAEPRRTKKARPPKQAMRTVREFQEPVPEEIGEGQEHERPHGPEFVDESPLSDMAESQLAMCHVSRVGPGNGQGWVGGMFYDYGDGRGPVAISKGPVGTFQKTADLFDVVVAEAGGSRYRFVSRGQAPVEETLPGPPKPLPMEQGSAPPPGFPNGAMPNARGGFDREPFVDQGPPLDPFDRPDFDPELGVAPEELPPSPQSGINGFQFNAATGRWIFYVNGIASKPPRGSRPPAFPGMPGAAGFGVGGFIDDHSVDPRIERLEKEILGNKESATDKLLREVLTELRESRKEKPESTFATMFSNQMQMQTNAFNEAQRQRAHELEMAKVKAAADEVERKAKIAAEVASAEKLKTLELEAIKAKADADKERAKYDAEAAKENARAMVASNERIATIQADANKQVLAAVTSVHKNNDAQLLKEGMQLAADVVGGKGTAEVIAGSTERLISSAVDGYVQIQAMRTGQNGGGSGGSPEGGPSDDDMTARMVGLLVKMAHKKAPPEAVILAIGGACDVSGFPATKLDPLITLGTPAVVGTYLDSAAAKAVDEGNKKKFLEAKALITSPEGAAWFNSVKAAWGAKRKAAANQVAGNGPAGQLPGPGK